MADGGPGKKMFVQSQIRVDGNGASCYISGLCVVGVCAPRSRGRWNARTNVVLA